MAPGTRWHAHLRSPTLRRRRRRLGCTLCCLHRACTSGEEAREERTQKTPKVAARNGPTALNSNGWSERMPRFRRDQRTRGHRPFESSIAGLCGEESSSSGGTLGPGSGTGLCRRRPRPRLFRGRLLACRLGWPFSYRQGQVGGHSLFQGACFQRGCLLLASSARATPIMLASHSRPVAARSGTGTIRSRQPRQG